MSFDVHFSRRASADMNALDRKVQAHIVARLDQLSEAPYDSRLSKKLTDQKGLRSARVGDWRILFTIEPEIRALVIDRVLNRKEAYRFL